MDKYSKAEIRKIVEEEGVEFIRLQFTDMFGMLKNIAVPARRLIKAMENCCTIDLASLEGFSGWEEEELYLKPDMDTFAERLPDLSVMCAWRTARNMKSVPVWF